MTAMLVGVSVVISAISLLIAIHAIVEVKSMQRSTHRVTFYDPQTQTFSNLTEEQKKKLQEPLFDNI